VRTGKAGAASHTHAIEWTYAFLQICANAGLINFQLFGIFYIFGDRTSLRSDLGHWKSQIRIPAPLPAILTDISAVFLRYSRQILSKYFKTDGTHFLTHHISFSPHQQQSIHNSSFVVYLTTPAFSAWLIRRILDWMTGFIDTLFTQLGTTGNYSVTTDLYALQFKVTHALGFSVFISRILATDFNTVAMPASL
jgi:hypothetical protein